jgi:hypothetical protein
LSKPSSRACKLAVSLFLFTVAFAGYMPGNMGCADSRWSVPTAVSLIDRHRFDLDQFGTLLKERGTDFTIQIDGHFYTQYPFGTSIAAAPGVWALRRVASRVFARSPRLYDAMAQAQWQHGCPPSSGEPVVALHSWVEKIIASAFVALTAVLIYLIAAARVSQPAAVALALTFAFATSAWSTASRSLWQHGPSMFLLTLALLLQERRRAPLLIGLALASACVIRPTNIIPLTLGSSLILWQEPHRSVAFAAGAAAVLVPFLLLNQHVYGMWLPPYYHPAFFHGNPFFGEALVGDLVSPGRGLFVYSPVFIFAIAGVALRIAQRRVMPVEVFAAGVVLLHWIVVARVNSTWWAGDSYGPRFFADMVPYLMYLLLPVVEWTEERAAPMRRFVLAVLSASVAIGVAMHAQGALNAAALLWNHEPTSIDDDLDRLWDWRHPPFLAGFVAPAPAPPPPDFASVACTRVPGVPQNLAVASNRASVVVLQWTRVSDAVLYIVEPGSSPDRLDAPTRETQATTMRFSHVPPGSYYARVRSRNGCGVSPASEAVRVDVR